jgi:tetratricopeptide (TPR) repeat protein
MKIVFKYSLCALLVLFCFSASAQANKDAAAEKCRQALEFEDNGDYNAALKLLADAQTLEPTNSTYVYETAYVWYLQKKYQKVIDVLVKLKDKTDSFDRVYQLLGKCYDVVNQNTKAMAIYEEGLTRFPKSGCLNYEVGLIWADKPDLHTALKYFEKGIEGDPAFADNYYWAAKVYCNSNEAMWGMIYGELFMNLEPTGERWQEISKLLYDTYKNQITFTAPGKPHVQSFSKRPTVMVDKGFKASFSTVYEPTLYIAAIPESAIDLNSLDRIRQSFLKTYLNGKYDVKYPNILYTYQDQVAKAGCIEAYNHWLLSAGDEAAFKIWKAQNPAKWQAFATWYKANPLKLDENNKFFRGQE